MTKVTMETMRPREVEAARNRAPVAYVPIGPIEWHGPHMPLGMDGLHAHHVAAAVARRIGGVVLPTFFLGADSLLEPGRDAQGLGNLGLPDEAHVTGMDFPGFPVKSLYIDEAVLGVLFRDVLRALERQGFRVVVFVNGHGAPNHQRMLRRLASEATRSGGLMVAALSAWGSIEPPALGPGHADRYETSIMCATHPDDVDLAELPARPAPLRYPDYGIVEGAAFDGHPGADFAVPPPHDPRASTAAEGEVIIAREVEGLSNAVLALIAALEGRRHG